MFVYLILCVLYFLSYAEFQELLYLRTFIKPLPIIYLIFLLIFKTGISSRFKKFILIGFIFSFVGDIILELDIFVPGLGSFLIAQLFFASGFSKGSKLHLSRLFPFLIYASFLVYIIYPNLGKFLVPVIVYAIAIVLMGWRASSRVSAKSISFYAGLYGAVIFILSDSLIAIQKFSDFDLPYSKYFIMLTYYTAQYLIYLSAKKES